MNAGVGAALLLLSMASTAWAHGQPASLQFWGNFPKSISQCQRAISHATATCIERSVRARTQCALSKLGGGTCDSAAIDVGVQAARTEARAIVRRVCSEREAQNLLYVDVSEAQIDVVNTCRNTDTAITSAILRPSTVRGEGAPWTEENVACIATVAASLRKFSSVALESVAGGLNRIASDNLTIADKRAELDRGTARIATRRAETEALITTACGPEGFESVYGRPIVEVVTAVSAQSSCFGGGLYVQDAVTCPAPVCGNGVQEWGEECDDANGEDGDGCSAFCLKM